MKRPSPGFTLIELASVLTITALLATLGWHGYQREVLLSRRAEARAAVQQALLQQQQHYARTGRYRAFLPGPDEREFSWHSGQRPADAAYLLRADACEDDGLQRCVQVSAQLAPGLRDTQCSALQADTRGRRSATGSGPCW